MPVRASVRAPACASYVESVAAKLTAPSHREPGMRDPASRTSNESVRDEREQRRRAQQLQQEDPVLKPGLVDGVDHEGDDKRLLDLVPPLAEPLTPLLAPPEACEEGWPSSARVARAGSH